MIKEKQEH